MVDSANKGRTVLPTYSSCDERITPHTFALQSVAACYHVCQAQADWYQDLINATETHDHTGRQIYRAKRDIANEIGRTIRYGPAALHP